MSARTLLCTRLVSAVECNRIRERATVVDGRRLGYARMMSQQSIRKYMAMSSDADLAIALGMDGEEWVRAIHEGGPDVFSEDLISLANDTYNETLTYQI